MDTIYALATPAGRSGVAVFRISGPAARRAVARMASLDHAKLPPRQAVLTVLRDGEGQTIDRGLLIFFANPHSFTGEDVVEIHTHGSRAVLEAMLETLSKIEGFRLAEPGEFSRRAFHNRKMDLTQAEGLADLIDAETAAQRKFALRQMEGETSRAFEAWRQAMLEALSQLEAYIDFPEEEIPESIKNNILNTVFKLRNEFLQHLSKDNIAERLRDGFRVVVAGPPNAGKSSLLNALAKREAAIVSPTPGTTRDAVDIRLDLGGYPVIVTDTAGLREDSADEIERRGVEIAREKIAAADLVLYLSDASLNSPPAEGWTPKADGVGSVEALRILNKIDLFPQITNTNHEHALKISAKTGEGLAVLLKEIENRIKAAAETQASGGMLLARARHREALARAAAALEGFGLGKDIALAAEDLRLAARELGKLTGAISPDEVLDSIFSAFCIGK